MVWPTCSETADLDLLLEEPPIEEQLEASWKVLRGGGDGFLALPRSSKEDLRKFVLEFMGGAIYTSAQVHRIEDVPMVFMPILFGLFKDWTEDDMKQVGVIWEYYDKALPRSINGMPVFTSCHLMHVEDWKRARLVIEREQLRQKDLEL
jgi:hypothetical protein